MPLARIKWFNDKLGYGYLQKEDGDELFFMHARNNDPGYIVLDEGDTVDFEMEETYRGYNPVIRERVKKQQVH